MPFRDSFDCLWCGQRHAARSPEDLEGWAGLCPDCLGRAQDNGFLAGRLRAALRERAAAARDERGEGRGEASARAGEASARGGHAPGQGGETGGSLARSIDDWYLRRGRFSGGPLRDNPWQMELDEVVRWLDALPLSGVITEVAAGTGFWSPLLARKGELWVYEADESALDAARERLVAHGLRAHLHPRPPLAEAERQRDGLFFSFLLGGLRDVELVPALQVLRGWLRAGGRLAFAEARDGGGRSLPGPRGELRSRTPAELRSALEASGLEEIEIHESASAFAMASAVAPALR
jgi:SAM-dependent methyltransferase